MVPAGNAEISRVSASFFTLLCGFSCACIYYYKFALRRRNRFPFALHLNCNPNSQGNFSPIFHGNRNPYSDGKLFVTSETGNILAARIQGILSFFCIKVDIVNFKDYHPDNFVHEKLLLIVASVEKEKDERLSRYADNVIGWLLHSAYNLSDRRLMEACRFGVISQVNGQTDSTIGRDLVQCLSLLGASEILPMAEVNQDSEGMEVGFRSWCEELVSKLRGQETDERKEILEFIADSSFYSDWDDVKKLDAYLDYCEYEGGFKPIGNAYDDYYYDLKETTYATNQTSPKNEQRNIYILLEHTNEGNSNDKTDVFSVASLYRVCLKTEYQTNEADVQAPALPIFNFTFDKYHSIIGCGAIGRQLFFIGGDLLVSNKDSPNVGNSNKMYILDTSLILDSSTEHDISKIIQTKSCFLNKSDPIVVTVGSKLVILPNNFGSKNGMNPTIDCYDCQKDSWESFDIFRIYNGYGTLKRNPPSSTVYKVLAHSVTDSKIFICLGMEAYAFDVDSGDLYLVGCLDTVCSREPFSGMGVYSCGCFSGLHPEGKHLHFYDYNPFLGNVYNHCLLKIYPHIELLSEHKAENVHGLISNLGQNGGENRLLVVRSVQGIGTAQIHGRCALVFDIFSVKPSKCYRGDWLFEKYHYTYHVDIRNGPIIDIKACFPIC